MNFKVLFVLLLTVLSVAVVPGLKGDAPVMKVDQMTGEVWRGRFDAQGRQHGYCTRHDRDGNLIQEDEFQHGMCVFRRRFDTAGNLTLELREGEDYHLVQIFPQD